MDDVSIQRIIFFVTMVEKSIGSPLNYKLVYENGLTLNVEDIEEFRSSSVWERDRHPEMDIYGAYTKDGEFTSSEYNDTINESSYNHNVESWSLMLYLICFLILIIFFLLISVMEVCCKRSVFSVPAAENQAFEVPPPPYDLFGPPSYDSLYSKKCQKKSRQKSKCSIFVIHLPMRKSSFDVVTHGGTGSEPDVVQNTISPPVPP